MIDEEITVYHNIGDPDDTTYEHKIKLEHFKVCDCISLYIDGKHVLTFDDCWIDDVLALFQRFNNIVYPNRERYKISNDEKD
jgi:hypothetical protein